MQTPHDRLSSWVHIGVSGHVQYSAWTTTYNLSSRPSGSQDDLGQWCCTGVVLGHKALTTSSTCKDCLEIPHACGFVSVTLGQLAIKGSSQTVHSCSNQLHWIPSTVSVEHFFERSKDDFPPSSQWEADATSFLHASVFACPIPYQSSCLEIRSVSIGNKLWSSFVSTDFMMNPGSWARSCPVPNT